MTQNQKVTPKPALLSIIIVSWNVKDDVIQCLQSLSSAPELAKGDWEIIVVDNASTDDTVDTVRRLFPFVRLIANRENVGFTRANNQGLKCSQSKYVFLLNPDTIADPKSIRKMVVFAEKAPEIGVIGPRLVGPDGTLQWSARSFPDIGAGLFRNTPLSRLFPNTFYERRYLGKDLPRDSPSEVDWVSGAALLVRRSVLNQIGLLDEDYWSYCEDVDLCWRVKAKGFKVIYYPEVTIVHKVGRSSDQRLVFSLFQHHRSMWKFFQKHYRNRYPFWIRPMVPLGIAIRLLGALSRLGFHRLLLWWLSRKARFLGNRVSAERPIRALADPGRLPVTSRRPQPDSASSPLGNEGDSGEDES
ncbi:MAG: glycosyltransferase family 2 protein [Armatimonadetes bacterium]|nr:glycosyltransferase family 2 protein [Armatimonadota bacterium]MDW8121852.1 glycosyltransferase family 2 protein [Armatimonadota bacterium]